MTVLRRGYVPVEPDATGFDDKLKQQLRQQDAGGKAGRQLGGQLNRALKRLDLPAIDIKADPKKALLAIDVTEQRLRNMAANATSVELKVQTEKALAELKRFRRQVGDTGDDAGKEFGGQLNRALAELDLKELNLDVDPKRALADIELVKKRLEALGRDSATVEVRVKTQKALSELAGIRNQIGDFGDDAGKNFFTKFTETLKGSPAATAGAVLGVALAPTIAGLVAAAVIGGAGVGGVVGGVTLAAKDPRIKTAGRELGQDLLADLERRSSGFITPVLTGIAQIRQGFTEMGPDLDRVFKSSRFVQPLVDGALKGAKGFISGFADAIDKADPVIGAFSDSIAQIGSAVGGFFRDVSSQAPGAAAAIRDVTSAITTVINIGGKIVTAGAAVKGWTTQVDKAIDKGRYWFEDNSGLSKSLSDIGISLDLTADGFKKGTPEANAYRAATTGVATATDYAILKQSGMTDAQIDAVDASGKYRVELAAQAAAVQAVARANGQLVASDDDVKTAQQAVTTSQQDLSRSLDQMGPKAGAAAQLVDSLKKATQNLYGPTIAAADANEAWEASMDNLTGSVKRNKDSLNIHTAAGRSNRDAVKDLVGKTNDLYFAEIATGGSVAEATRKHTARIVAIKEEARRLGLDKKATQELINTYGGIPKKKQTDIVMSGLQKVINSLNELYIYQRSLAEGIPVRSVRAELSEKKGPQHQGFGGGGYHEGGWTGPGSKYEPAGVVHADEFVIKKESRRQIERQSPGLLQEMNATGQVPGYRDGGRVATLAPVDRSTHWPFKVDAGATKLYSKKYLQSKVVPAFSGHWPSSPAAQRGDSGVWRRVVALIKSTGPLSGHFGNAYRPGDPLWHGSGRAVDWMGYNQDRLATFLAARRPLELIHRTKNRDYAYTRGKNKGSFRESLMEAHRNHVHIAMANGGVIGEPVIGTGIRSGASYSFGERGPETVTPGAGPGHATYNINVNVPVGAHPAETGRQIVMSIQAFERGNGTRWRE